MLVFFSSSFSSIATVYVVSFADASGQKGEVHIIKMGLKEAIHAHLDRKRDIE